MKLKILYRKNLKMSDGKLAAQCVHAGRGLGGPEADAVIVLGVSDTKFRENCERGYVVVDAGRTELEPGTETCVAFWEG